METFCLLICILTHFDLCGRTGSMRNTYPRPTRGEIMFSYINKNTFNYHNTLVICIKCKAAKQNWCPKNENHLIIFNLLCGVSYNLFPLAKVTMTKRKASYGNSYLNNADNNDTNSYVQDVSFKCTLQLC